jgi:phosphoglucomutase
LKVLETPVGFKFIGELLAKGEAVMGGEESAGLSIKGHVPDKDGILACLLVAEMVARTRKSLTDLLADLFGRVGAVYTRREDLPITAALRDRLTDTLDHPPPSFAGSRVRRVNRLDGCKLLLEDGSWFLFRLSGTEPIVRCYGEAESRARLDALMAAGRELAEGS